MILNRIYVYSVSRACNFSFHVKIVRCWIKSKSFYIHTSYWINWRERTTPQQAKTKFIQFLPFSLSFLLHSQKPKLFHISKWKQMKSVAREQTITYSVLFIPTLARERERILTDSYRTFIDIVFSPLNKKTNNISQVFCVHRTLIEFSHSLWATVRRSRKIKNTTHGIREASASQLTTYNVIV